MKLSLFRYTLLSLFLVITPAWSQDTTAIDKEMRAALNGIVGNPIPGISVAIANSEGALWSGAAGFSNIEERQIVSQSHLFGIGNITNQFVGTVILQMAKDGIIDLTATPLSILGDTVADIENADSATLLQLLTHTSGIYSWSDNQDWVRRGRGVQMNPKYVWRRDEQLKYATKDTHPARHKAGNGYSYSKSNYTLLGLVIEKLTGGPIELEVRSRILEPLKLRNTYYDTYETVANGSLVGNYHLASSQFIATVGINSKFEFGDNQLINTSGASLSAEGLAGNMITTPRELAQFAAALWSGEILDSEATAKITPKMRNGQIGIHSEILGFTADIRQIENSDLVIVSIINLGTVNTGENETNAYLANYLDEILMPIAKKYALVK